MKISKRQRRRLLDAAISIPLFWWMLSQHGCLALLVIIGYGFWNYWDGMTRLDLPET